MMSTSGSVGAGAGSPSAIFGDPPGMSPGASSPPAMGPSRGVAGANLEFIGRDDELINYLENAAKLIFGNFTVAKIGLRYSRERAFWSLAKSVGMGAPRQADSA